MSVRRTFTWIGIGLVFAVGVQKCACQKTRYPLADTRWDAGMDRYDYLESFDFRKGGTGRFAQGDSQVIRFDLRFRYAQEEGNAVEIHYVDRDEKDWKRRLTFEVDDGTYRFTQQTPRGPTKIVCRSRISFSSAPSPYHSTRVFYGSCKSE